LERGFAEPDEGSIHGSSHPPTQPQRRRANATAGGWVVAGDSQMCSRYIIAWKLRSTMRADDVTEALELETSFEDGHPDPQSGVHLCYLYAAYKQMVGLWFQ
jgi:hypothetical protein